MAPRPKRPWTGPSREIVALGIAALAITHHVHRAWSDGGNVFVLHDLHDFNRFSSRGDDMAWMNKSRSLLGFDIMPGIMPLARTGSPRSHFDWAAPQPGVIAQPGATGFMADPLGFVVDPMRRGLLYAQDEWGLRTDLYEALVLQAATDTLAGARSTVGVSRLNLRSDLLVFRDPGVGMGRLTFQIRSNATMPGGASMSASVGAASALDEVQSTFDNQLVRLAWSQSFFNDRWMVSIGKLNPSDYVADNIFANDESRQFLAQPFDGNSTWPVTFQDKCEGVGTIAIPTDWLFLSGYAVSAAGVNDAWLDLSLGDGYAVAGEVGLLAEFDGRPCRVSWAWCGTDANATSVEQGVDGAWGTCQAVTAQMLPLPQMGAWFQWSQADADVASGATHELALGLTIDDCFERRGDGFGLAIARTEPVGTDVQTQWLTEAYYRFQVNGSLQLTLDAQLLAPSASELVDDPVLVGGVRAVWRF
ncbi:MAG: carbohydrate porin [Phycisphaerae bacterium]|nr:carbohydrate porin [Phycisphaerae bacterium]